MRRQARELSPRSQQAPAKILLHNHGGAEISMILGGGGNPGEGVSQPTGL